MTLGRALFFACVRILVGPQLVSSNKLSCCEIDRYFCRRLFKIWFKLTENRINSQFSSKKSEFQQICRKSDKTIKSVKCVKRHLTLFWRIY